ncbi:MAG: Crp/Fnr family transcriptional regulator [Nitrospiraceae bacterium]|nr:Crp/Fnr family transcriptional regulator [Nitrospiraceae bacterium]
MSPSVQMPVFQKWMAATRPDREISLRRKGESLFFQGDPSDYFYVVTEGRILFVKESPFGTPLVLERLLPGDFVAGFAVIFDFPYPAGAVCDCPSRAVGYSKKNLLAALDRDRDLRREVNTELGERFRMYQSRLLYAHMPIEVRLSQALVALSGRGTDVPVRERGASYRDSIVITRTVLAQMCLTTVETAIRVTRMWEKAGKLDLSKKGIIRIVDPAFFEGIVHGHSLRL